MKFHHPHCLICNEQILPDGLVSRSLVIGFDASSRQWPSALWVHDECARRAAHPSFDWSAVEQVRRDLQALFDQAPRSEQ